MSKDKIILIGSAFGHGAQIYSTNQSPGYIQHYFQNQNPTIQWGDIVETLPLHETSDDHGRNYPAVIRHNTKLYQAVKKCCVQGDFPLVIGGDHSCGIGTWSAVTDFYDAEESFGLVWMDAHMDAHTLTTSPSKAYHGMPLSVLLGEGDSDLQTIGKPKRKVNPQHLVLIGIRSFEQGEQSLLERLGVKIYYMHDVKRMGMKAILSETLERISNGTKGFGVSVDLDGFDPLQAPGVGSPAPHGLDFDDTLKYLPLLLKHQSLKALEITEFNPTLDKNNQTAHLLVRLIETMATCRQS